MRIGLAGCLAVVSLLFAGSARAEEAVSLQGGYGILNAPARVVAAAVLIPGGDGRLGIGADGAFRGLRGNQLVRTRAAYARQGVATLVVDADVSIAAAVTYLRRFGRPVAIVATSRGTLRVASGLAAQPNGIVLASGFLGEVESAIGSPAALPPTLVVAHRHDGCRFTSPVGVEPFAQWAGGRARVVWLDGGPDEGNPCQAAGHHGFAGLDGQVVAAVARFLKGLR